METRYDNTVLSRSNGYTHLLVTGGNSARSGKRLKKVASLGLDVIDREKGLVRMFRPCIWPCLGEAEQREHAPSWHVLFRYPVEQCLILHHYHCQLYGLGCSCRLTNANGKVAPYQIHRLIWARSWKHRLYTIETVYPSIQSGANPRTPTPILRRPQTPEDPRPRQTPPSPSVSPSLLSSVRPTKMLHASTYAP